MSLVLDSSLILAWVYKNETTEAVERVIEILKQTAAWVPSLWHLEVANVLQIGVRRRRYPADFRDSALADLSSYPIYVDSETNRNAWGATVRLAERHELTVYDASYLELALRRGLPLATLDKDLRSAASAERVALLGV